MTTRLPIHTDEGMLSGFLRVPDEQGPYPALVLGEGSGRGKSDPMGALARALRARGIATLVYRKRASGYSALRRDYDRLARDARAAVSTLAGQPLIDSQRLGLLGFSEGGWVAARAAVEAVEARFLVLASCPIVSPLEQAVWFAESRMRDANAPEFLVRAAVRGIESGRDRVGYLSHDIRPDLARLDTPVLAAFGGRDRSIPLPVALSRLAALPVPPAVAIYDDLDHGLQLDREAGGLVDDVVRLTMRVARG